MCKQKINDKDAFWKQLGFEIKNEHIAIISVIAKHSSLSHNCTYKQNDKEINQTLLQRIVVELQLDEVLRKTSNTNKIDYLITDLTDKGTFWNKMGFETKNKESELMSIIVKYAFLLENSTYNQDNMQFNLTILIRLAKELPLNEILKKYFLMDSKRKMDNFLNQIQTFKRKIKKEHSLRETICAAIAMKQIGLAISSKGELLSLVTKNLFFSKRSDNDKKIMLQQLVEEFEISGLLNEYRILTSKWKVKMKYRLMNICNFTLTVNVKMDFVDTQNIIDDKHYSQTLYKLVKMSDEIERSGDSTDLDKIQTLLWNINDCTDYVNKFKHFIEIEQYDTESVEYDIDMSSGNIFNCIQNENVIDCIKYVINQTNTSIMSDDIFAKYNHSLTIVAGSYNVYLKNEKLFGDKYILLQQIDKTYFKDCSTQFTDNLYMNSFNNISTKHFDEVDTNLSKEISRYQFAINIINNLNITKYK
eukprot:431021_1